MTYPISIERDEHGAIRITWDDQAQTMWTPLELRQRCPCATCREKKREPVERAQPAPPFTGHHGRRNSTLTYRIDATGR
jgi:DUF971 family protein